MHLGDSENFILWDSEFWAEQGSQDRHWAGLNDYPPLLIQIVAAKLATNPEVAEISRFSRFVRPFDEFGREARLTPFFTELTGISQAMVDAHAMPLDVVMRDFAAFAEGVYCYSFGVDNLATIVPSCYIAGLPAPLRPEQARDIRHVLARAGISESETSAIVSGDFAKFVGAPDGGGAAHNAEHDVDSLVSGVIHLHDQGRILAEWLTRPETPARG